MTLTQQLCLALSSLGCDADSTVARGGRCRATDAASLCKGLFVHLTAARLSPFFNLWTF